MKYYRQPLPKTAALMSFIIATLYYSVLFSNSISADDGGLAANHPYSIEQNVFIKDTAIPIGNGSWFYDTALLEQDLGDGKYWRPEEGRYHPISSLVSGLFAGKIFTYNARAEARKKINQFYNYATTPETTCKIPKNITSSANELLKCSAADRAQWDNGEITITHEPDQVMLSTLAYLEALTPLKEEMNSDFITIPVVDARLDQRLYGLESYLDSLNHFNQQQAEYLAEKTAALFCTYDHVPSVQFDIEPFDFNHSGQAFYYKKLAFYFSGQGDPLTNSNNEQVFCKNSKYPHGRSWSVFTFPHKISPEFSQAMNRYGNGFVIVAGYDMENPTGATAGIHNDVAVYQNLFKKDLLETMTRAQQQNFYYKIAIPAAASTHEFTSLLGQDPKGVMQDGTLTGQFKRTFPTNIIDYTKAAVDAINDAYIIIDGEKTYLLDDPKFIGIDLWGWASHIRWPLDKNTGRTEFTPGYPPLDVLEYLQENLPVSRYYFSIKPKGINNKNSQFKASLTISRSHKGATTFANHANTVYTAKYFGIRHIDNIKFYDGNQLLAEDDHLPYQYITDNSNKAPKELVAKAYYNSNLIAESSVTDKNSN